MLVLASQSPRRRELLEAAGFRFTVRPAGVEEVRLPGEAPEGYVRRLARAKAEAVDRAPHEMVLGADTVVLIDGRLLEKPTSPDDAAAMLEALSGREHRVLTGICMRQAAEVFEAIESTRVRFSPLSREEIEAYVATGEPMDKAGAYAIQGLASKFIERVEGCYFNVVGLPVALVYRGWKRLGGSVPL